MKSRRAPTPGPWRYLHDDQPGAPAPHTIWGLRRPDGSSDLIAVLSGVNARANGALIAAAPDLLAALEDLLAHRECPIASPEAVEARAAIAKARGKGAP
jgi:hypothetical protein